ncbi:GNAT family N-acetyltransferase [Breoghania sp. L-A4]|uniref:GNAT family N-acetyltransferase n=1 Tax=Breoghania sp. L-A4 TaxID=2304600 RepID=UPI000E35E45E|nr:GNAT family N-acetyltransferase [Breoghania sp. L-A4]AXS42089.1 N-acetyltransferase family protein [Breoghania sp. L-A4]
MSHSIRPAAPADIPAITAIYAHAVTHGTASFELTPPNETEMRRRFDALMASHHPYLVFEDDGVVLGYAYAGPHRPRPAYRWAVESSIYIAPERQGMGIGKALLAALVDEATVRGFRQMIGVVGDSTHAASIRLHEAAGFEVIGTVKNVGRKFDRWLDIVMLQRALGDGAKTPPER